MAWRITDSVIRGEIDNRVKNVVTGNIWLRGLDEPVRLELHGNCHPDLAGCFLQFRNPGVPAPLRTDALLHSQQIGTAGDMTASRKVRVPDLPIEEFYLQRKAGLNPPEHMGNCLYLEWFSEFNGRVVIEGVDWITEVSTPDWRLTPEDEARRAEDAAAGFAGFMEKLSQAIESSQPEPVEDKDWNEFDYERLLKESDARTDKYLELLDKYGDSPEAEELIAEEMGWTADGGGEDTDEEEGWLASPDLGQVDHQIEGDLSQPSPETEGVDWIRRSDGGIVHPLQHRAMECALRLWQEVTDRGVAGGVNESPELQKLMEEYQMTVGRLAGALNSLGFGRHLRDGAMVVATLKRALSHLHNTQNALELVAQRELLPPPSCDVHRRELFEIREEILRLMDEFRGRE